MGQTGSSKAVPSKGMHGRARLSLLRPDHQEWALRGARAPRACWGGASSECHLRTSPPGWALPLLCLHRNPYRCARAEQRTELLTYPSPVRLGDPDAWGEGDLRTALGLQFPPQSRLDVSPEHHGKSQHRLKLAKDCISWGGRHSREWLCTCVCLHVCTHTQTCTHVCACTCALVHVRTHVCVLHVCSRTDAYMCVYLHMCTCACIYMCVCTHVLVYACTQCTRALMLARTRMCSAYMCTHVCLHVCVCMQA